MTSRSLMPKAKMTPPWWNDSPMTGMMHCYKTTSSDFQNNTMSEFLNRNIQHFVQRCMTALQATVYCVCRCSPAVTETLEACER